MDYFRFGKGAGRAISESAVTYSAALAAYHAALNPTGIFPQYRSIV
jgi:hypothetical protein